MTSIASVFLETWAFEKHENFDDYMEKRGTSWIIRKFVLSLGHTMTWTNNGNGEWSIVHSKKKDIIYTFRLGEEFTAMGFDQIERKMVVTVEGDAVIERLRRTDKDCPDEISTYRVEGDYLVQSMVYGNDTCKKFFKRKI